MIVILVYLVVAGLGYVIPASIMAALGASDALGFIVATFGAVGAVALFEKRMHLR